MSSFERDPARRIALTLALSRWRGDSLPSLRGEIVGDEGLIKRKRTNESSTLDKLHSNIGFSLGMQFRWNGTDHKFSCNFHANSALADRSSRNHSRT